MRTITLIILHCSATRSTQRYTLEQCRADHRRRGWKDIGYHYYSTRDGTVHNGRPLHETGAHCRGHNSHSIGICYEGGLNDKGLAADTRTTAQRHSMRQLLEELHRRFPDALILGHRDLSPDTDRDGRITPEDWLKQCPAFDAFLDYADLEPDGLFT